MDSKKTLKTSLAQLRANAKYDKSHTKQFILKLNIKTDNDIIKKLNQQPNKQGYVKKIIRKDIQK